MWDRDHCGRKEGGVNKEDCLDGGMKEGANPLSTWRRSLGTKNEKMDMKRPSS